MVCTSQSLFCEFVSFFKCSYHLFFFECSLHPIPLLSSSLLNDFNICFIFRILLSFILSNYLSLLFTLNDLLGMTSYSIKCVFPKLHPILLYFYIVTGFSIQLMEFARVASYQNLSFCWTVPLFLKFHLNDFLVIIQMILMEEIPS